MKKYLVPIVVIVMAISGGFNIYFFGYKMIYEKGFADGVNAVSNNIVSQYKAEGKLSMVLDGEQLVLVPQDNVSIGADSLTKNTTGSNSGPFGKQDDIDNYFQ